VVDAALAIIQAQGGTIVMTDIPSQADGTLGPWGICAGAADSKANDDTNCSVVLKFGFKRDFNLWLDSLGSASDIDSLADLMAFNLANAGNNAIKYGQTRFDISQEMDLAADLARYEADRATDIFLTATHGIDEVMAAENLDALLFGGSSSAGLAARPGYPTVIVPFGFVPNSISGTPAGLNPLPQPYGISFTGSAFDEPTLIKLAYAFEQATRQRVTPASAPPLRKDVKGNPNR
jgi:amidase